MADQITWADIEKLWEYAEKEKKEREKLVPYYKERLRKKREREAKQPKSKVYLEWEKWAGKKREKEWRKYRPSIKERVKKYFGGLEDLVKSLKQGAKKLEYKLEFKQLAHAYKPGLLDKILNYVRSKRKLKLYLLALFLLYFAFRGKSSVIGYTVMESVTNSYFVSYLLIFILVVCLIFYQLDKK